MSNGSTTVVFVPGAWHSPLCFLAVGDRLETAGYKTRYVSLPSCGPAEHIKSFAPDVDKIRKVVTEEADAGQSVIVVCHSYGGVPSTEAVKGLDIKSRAAAGFKGGIAHLVFCCSFIIPEGKSLIAAFGGNDLPWFRVSEDKTWVGCADSENIFYNDMRPDLVDTAIAHLKPHSYQPFHSPVTYAGWQHVPATYIYCLQDNAIPIFIQKMMVEEFAKGVPIKTETVDASHSPFFSKPEETAQAIRRAAGEAV